MRTDVFTVSSYTREAGVRTLERKIGAICRAVAVKVAEHMHKQTAADRLDDALDKDQTVVKGDSAVVVDIAAQTTNVSPPEMPIVIDQAAVEDILGVRIAFD